MSTTEIEHANGTKIVTQSGAVVTHPPSEAEPLSKSSRLKVVVDGKGMGPMFRALGTADIDGNGTPFQLPDGAPFECAGPFVLLDVVAMPSAANFKAPFCAHPHSGARCRRSAHRGLGAASHHANPAGPRGRRGSGFSRRPSAATPAHLRGKRSS